tara:strand:- start:1643 stop:2188 length:546 start_codon:yes stop_codon:yes gene_type:complete
MKDLEHFLNEGLFKEDKKMKPHESMIAKSVVDFMKNELKFDANKIVVKKKTSNNLIGDISLSDASVNKGNFILNLNPNQGTKMQMKALIHELTHINQVVKGTLKPSEDWKSIVWDGSFTLSIRDYKKSMKDFNEYSNLPWEKEAYSNMKTLIEKYLNSKYFKDLKGKDATLDFIIDNIEYA